MQWQRYPKIPLSSNASSSAEGEYIVTEKIHGANFSVAVPPDGEVSFASRGGILKPGDNFFGFRSQGIDKYLAPRARKLRDALVADGNASTAATVVVYGELCGGEYPHADVPMAAASTGPVQRGCWYSPTLVFVGFDVAVFERHCSLPRFLSFDDARNAATVGMVVALLAWALGLKLRPWRT